ncbi:hypothetical protein [Pseudomonas sp.]|uniref:hypothetical protein n=1 Tax=Pseudomonas sp. TaxID=306 RepID=UPI003C5A768F
MSANIFLPACAAFAQQAQAAAADTQIISPALPVWLVERPNDDGSGLTASVFGDSAYGDYHAKAGLVIGCHPQNPQAALTLLIAPKSLGFDSDEFEGKDATAEGPLRITAGKRSGVDLRVNGIWTHGGVFQIGTIFALNAITPLPRDELAYLASDAARGRTLTLSLAPAEEGGKRLTATFSIPSNNQGLKEVLQPCLGAATKR